MRELITLERFGPILEDLRIAFDKRIPDKELRPKARIYLEALEGCTVDAVVGAAKFAIKNDDYFPKAKRLRALALQYESRGSATLPARREALGEACHVCGAKPEHHEYRQKTGAIVQAVRKDNGQPLFYEGRPVMVPEFETIVSPRATIIHDRAKHFPEERNA